MAFALDTLGYAKRLRDAGMVSEHAEAAAEAPRDFIMAELVTKADLAASKTELTSAIDHMASRLTISLGAMIATGIAILGAFLKLTH